MSTAIVLTGHMRTYATNYLNQKWFLYQKLYHPHFFVATYSDPQSPSAELLRKHYEFVSVKRYPENDLVVPDGYEEAALGAPYCLTSPIPAILSQFLMLKRGWELVQQCNHQFDYVVRCRPDLHFHEFVRPLLLGNECHTPWWGKFGGVNDRFAVMSWEAAQHYFNIYDNLPELIDRGCPFHGETLVRANLEICGVDIHDDLRAVFSIDRLNGDRQFPEILSHDLAQLMLDKRK